MFDVCLCQGPVSGERLSSQSASHGVWKGERLFIHLTLWLKTSCGFFSTVHFRDHLLPYISTKLEHTHLFTQSSLPKADVMWNIWAQDVRMRHKLERQHIMRLFLLPVLPQSESEQATGLSRRRALKYPSFISVQLCVGEKINHVQETILKSVLSSVSDSCRLMQLVVKACWGRKRGETAGRSKARWRQVISNLQSNSYSAGLRWKVWPFLCPFLLLVLSEKIPAFGCCLEHFAPDPYGPSCSRRAHRKVDPPG